MSDADEFRVLVVCVGNQCRSPLAERLLRVRLPQTSARVVVSSAGTVGPPGVAMDPLAEAELVRLGGDPAGFRSRRVTPGLLAEQHLVLTATRDLRTEVLGIAPRLMRRTFTLRELAAIVESERLAGLEPAELVARAAALRSRAPTDIDVRDPIGAGSTVHREVADELAACVDSVVGALG